MHDLIARASADPDATAAAVPVLAQLGLCGAKNRQAATKIFGAARRPLDVAAAGCANARQVRRRHARTTWRIEPNAKNKGFFLGGRNGVHARRIRDASVPASVRASPAGRRRQAARKKSAGVVDSGKNRD